MRFSHQLALDPAIGVVLREKSPESGRMVGDDRVAKLVQEHVVDQRRRQEQQLHVETDDAAARATGPPCPLRPHRDRPHRKRVFMCQDGQTGHDGRAGFSRQPAPERRPAGGGVAQAPVHDELSAGALPDRGPHGSPRTSARGQVLDPPLGAKTPQFKHCGQLSRIFRRHPGASGISPNRRPFDPGPLPLDYRRDLSLIETPRYHHDQPAAHGHDQADTSCPMAFTDRESRKGADCAARQRRLGGHAAAPAILSAQDGVSRPVWRSVRSPVLQRAPSRPGTRPSPALPTPGSRPLPRREPSPRTPAQSS